MATQPQMSVTPIEVTEAVNAVIDAHERSWNTHDVEAYLNLYTDDGEMVNVIGMHRRGKQELREEFTSLHATIMKGSRIRMLERFVRLLGPGIALAHSTWDMTGMERVPGWNVPEVRKGIFSYVMVERNKSWFITSGHNTDTLPLANITKSA